MGFKIGKFLKKVTPFIGATVGSYFGGPAGAVIGSSIAGASTRGKGNKMKGALSGGMQGAAYASMAPGLVGRFAPGSEFATRLAGMNSPSLLNQMGMGSAPGYGGGLGLFGNAGSKGIFGSNSQFGSLLGGALKGIAGGQGGEQAQAGAGQYSPQEASRRAFSSSYDDSSDGITPSGYEKSDEVIKSLISQGASPMEIFIAMSPTFNKNTRKWKNPNKDESWKNPNESFAKGGAVKHKLKVKGYIKVSNSGGQDDDIGTILEPDSYVWNATDLSLLGDGFSDNGAKKIKDFEEKLLRHHPDNFTKTGITRAFGGHSPGIPARVSNGEYPMSAKAVRVLGNGDIQKGVKLIDNMRKNLRKHKGVKSILPPKTKDMHYYMKGGS